MTGATIITQKRPFQQGMLPGSSTRLMDGRQILRDDEKNRAAPPPPIMGQYVGADYWLNDAMAGVRLNPKLLVK